MKKDPDNIKQIIQLSGNKRLDDEFKELSSTREKNAFLNRTFKDVLDKMIVGPSFTQ